MTEWTTETRCIAFEDTKAIGAGRLADVALAVKAASDLRPESTILVFDEVSSRPIELDLRGGAEEVLARLTRAEPAKPVAEPDSAPRGPGRPKLGVVAREVTLLPLHWAWLAEQPGSASVTLRKLVEQARRASAGVDRKRKAREAAYRFMNVMAGNEAGYEESIRALYADDEAGLRAHVEAWPPDVRAHALDLARRAFETRD